MPHPSPCTIPRLPRGNPDNLSASQTYQLAHSVRCRLMLTADRPDRNLRFVLGHAFTLDKIMLRLVEIEDEDEQEQQAAARKATPPPTEPGRVSFGSAPASKRQRDQKMGVVAPAPDSPRKRGSPPPPPRVADEDDDADEPSTDEDEDAEGLQLTLTTSHIKREAPASTVPEPVPSVADMVLPNLVPSSDSDSDEEEDEEPRPRIPDSVLETIIEEDGNEELAALYEEVAGCPCHGKAAPVIERIWEIPQEVLEEEQKRYDEKQAQSKSKKVGEKKKPGRRMGAGRRMGVVRVSA